MAKKKGVALRGKGVDKKERVKIQAIKDAQEKDRRPRPSRAKTI